MRIHCFGDSWTEGIGVEWAPGNGIIPMEVRYNNNWGKERELYSYPGQLKTLLGEIYEVNNFGRAGYSNFEIYNSIFDNLGEKKIVENDLVIVCFSSIIREPLNYLTTGNNGGYGFIHYSNSTLATPMQEYPHWLNHLEDNSIKDACISMYMNYLVSRINYQSLYEISMNYICNLQIIFESLGIHYLFLNAFENVVSQEISFYNQIKWQNWILPNYTLSEYLLDRRNEIDESLPYSVWEDDRKDAERCQDGPHPNRIGYGFIAELIYSEILNRKILKNSSVGE